MSSHDLLTRMIKAGAGETPADLVIKNVRMLDVITGAITPTDIAIVGDRIVGTHAEYQGKEVIGGGGRFAVPGFIDTLAAFQDGHIDGHAPLLAGLALNGYLAAKIRTDHEATTAAEAREKLSKGMAILIREGSVSKDLNALAEILDENTSSFVALC